jgi:hypothetical protein
MTKSPSPANDRIVCTLLAEQVSVMREKMDSMNAFDLLWRTTALLSWLSGLIADSARHAGPANPVLERERAEALAEVAEIRRSLDELAFFQAQRADFARQIADCVVTALERMAHGDAAGARFSSGDLAALYVSEDQRKLHESVIKRLGVEAEHAIP